MKLKTHALVLAAGFLSTIYLTSIGFAKDKSSGCGVGWMIAKDMSLVSSATRQTTHGVPILNPAFSMTSGTSGCAKHSIVYNEKKGLHFVESQELALEIEIAHGEGQLVEGLAFALGCHFETAENTRFASQLQKRYPEIFKSESQSPRDTLNGIIESLSADEELSSKCGNGNTDKSTVG